MKNKLTRSLAFGIAHANQQSGPITFGGVPNNFNYAPGGGNNSSTSGTAPISGNNAVPNPTPNFPNSLSKVNPGVNSTSSPDPNTPPNLVKDLPQAGSSPLAEFAKLFDNTPEVGADGKPIKPAPNVLDSGVSNYAEIAKKMDFVSNVATDDQKAALVKGGEEAVGALMEILNTFGQQVYSQAAATSTQVTKKGFEIKSKEMQEQINRAIQFNGLSESLLNKDSRLADPSVAPLVQVVQQQMIAKFPGLTRNQLEEKVVTYFNTAFSDFGKTKAQEQEQQLAAEKPFNFLEFLQQ
jgi:hypothetical protein